MFIIIFICASIVILILFSCFKFIKGRKSKNKKTEYMRGNEKDTDRASNKENQKKDICDLCKKISTDYHCKCNSNYHISCLKKDR